MIVVLFIAILKFAGKAEGEMEGMQVKQLSCCYPAVMRLSDSNHRSGLAYWNFNLFSTVVAAFFSSLITEKVTKYFNLFFLYTLHSK